MHADTHGTHGPARTQYKPSTDLLPCDWLIGGAWMVGWADSTLQYKAELLLQGVADKEMITLLPQPTG